MMCDSLCMPEFDSITSAMRLYTGPAVAAGWDQSVNTECRR